MTFFELVKIMDKFAERNHVRDRQIVIIAGDDIERTPITITISDDGNKIIIEVE